MDDSSNNGASIILAVAFGLLYVILLATGSCDIAPDKANSVLRRDGVSQIVLKGHAYAKCARSEAISTEFEGVKGGEKVSGCVCGVFTGGPFVIRYNP